MIKNKDHIGTDLDEVLEEHEHTADQVTPANRQRLPKEVEQAIADAPQPDRRALIEERAVALGLDKRE